LDRRDLGARVLRLFLMHALRDGYFHADMHQGNLKVLANGDIVAYDFGIMGHIDEYTRRVYAEILFGFIRKDYKRVAEVHFEAGYVPADRDVDEFARALRAVGEPIFGMDATRISMGRLLNYLFEVTERFGMETRTELILCRFERSKRCGVFVGSCLGELLLTAYASRLAQRCDICRFQS